ncbi:serine/threonine-protein kinase PEPKR2 [Malania oleifera]|uniref:serine/threonine-protein kinase PEPKR2 n=1 Tax=Malania oleifera TaxID=397392 RepID=UPI0025ADE9BD|nr:serine/threonine-protein kinase PEPKR2 [Malania oleifera]XP_057974158.1 serine/threonine-protein kinase PEPKR2 [Malania oleifera]XP_057974159.1 serine/threonine-protein kinase PEPKR2 [Malania oleifera]
MRMKRKGSEVDVCLKRAPSPCDSQSSLSNIRAHYSLEDYARLKKRCRDGGCDKPVGSCKSRLEGVATAPPCGVSSLVRPGRGLKRKIGCIDVATKLGRKKKIEDDYVSGATIGHGKFGSVSICRSRVSGVEFACKTLKKADETVHREVEIMQHLSGHPGVVTLQAVYEDSECFHLVMELCSGGRLVDQMVDEWYSEHRAANILKELMVVIKYCHDMGVVHRDIKPENILLTSSGKIKLADFGLAMRVAGGQTLTGLAGSPAYVAPEVLIGNYSEKADIWSVGVLLHALLVGVLPFQGDSLEALFEAIKNVKLDFHTGKWNGISKPARNLIERMLTRDVSVRITVDEVLVHPWILFYTERTLKRLCIKSKSKSQSELASDQISVRPRTYSGEEMDNDSLSKGSTLSPLSQSLGCKSKEQEHDDSGLVDALAVAISQVRISEPKRSRLCGPSGPMQEHPSSNLKANALCKAF